MSILGRIGVFFTLLGIALIAFFVFSDMAKQPNYELMLAGAVILSLGIFMLVKSPRQPPVEAGRFRTVKKMMTKKPKK